MPSIPPSHLFKAPEITMGLESKWADAPNDESKHAKHKTSSKPTKKQPHNTTDSSKGPENGGKKDRGRRNRRRKSSSGGSPPRPSSQPQTIHAQPDKHHHRPRRRSRPQTHPQTRLVFSASDTDLESVKVEPGTKPKEDVLKQRIEEQKRILQEKQHKKQQDELLKNFLSSDAKLEWDEDEEDQIIEKLNRSLVV